MTFFDEVFNYKIHEDDSKFFFHENERFSSLESLVRHYSSKYLLHYYKIIFYV